MQIEKTEIELLNAFHAGNQECFLELVERFTVKVLNLATRITRNHQDAEEVVQDVFMTLYQKSRSFEGKSALSSWIYRITVNAAFMRMRSRKRHLAISLEDVSPSIKENWVAKDIQSNNINYMISGHELREALEGAVSRLPEEYRDVFVLRDVDGMSNEEVAEILSISVAAVKSRLHRGRLMLQKKLERYHADYSNESQIMYGPKVAQMGKLN